MQRTNLEVIRDVPSLSHAQTKTFLFFFQISLNSDHFYSFLITPLSMPAKHPVLYLHVVRNYIVFSGIAHKYKFLPLGSKLHVDNYNMC